MSGTIEVEIPDDWGEVDVERLRAYVKDAVRQAEWLRRLAANRP